jgi:predicted pyridoxine 5'-phosphate oxidase superfamily flavin-nucleotide-binding protein
MYSKNPDVEMGILTADIQMFVRKQKLGFIATVCPDGTPNLSPKGTTTVWDDDHLIFADIHSPGTVNNLLYNPSIEINVVDVFIRKGYRFKGTGRVLSNGSLFEDILSFYNKDGFTHVISNIVLVKIERVLPIISPAYDRDISEEEVKQRWMDYWNFEKKI